MASMDLRSIVVKKYRHHYSKVDISERKNILNQNFESSTINQKWCTDITYIHTIKDGWTYLASVMDIYSKKIIGYAYGKFMTVELAVKAVQNACLNVKNTKGIIHSFSRKGNPYDNACIESFHSVLKKEEIHHHKYYDIKIASKAIFEYIESWYNKEFIVQLII